MIQVYHNPRCGKSRECVAFLDEANIDYQIVSYLKDAPSESELRTLLTKLGMKPIAIVRQKEAVWMEQYRGRDLSDDEIITALATNPILIERPIVVNGENAVIARPFSKVTSIL